MTKTLTICFALLLTQSAGVATAQEQKPRDMTGFVEARPIFLSWAVPLEEHEKLIEQARSFLWSNWQKKQRAIVAIRDCTIYPEGCYDHKNYNFSAGPDGQGRWRLLLEEERVVLDRPDEGRRAERSKYETVYSDVERVEAGKEVPCRPFFREPMTVEPGDYRLLLTSRDDNGQATSCALI